MEKLTITIFKDEKHPHWILELNLSELQFDVYPKNFIGELKKKKLKLKLLWKIKNNIINVVSYQIISKNQVNDKV